MTQNIMGDNLLVPPVKPPVPVRDDNKPTDFSRVIAKQKQAAEQNEKLNSETHRGGNLKPENGKPLSEDEDRVARNSEEALIEDPLFLGELTIPVPGIEFLDKQLKGQMVGKAELNFEAGLLRQKAGLQFQSLLAKENSNAKPDPNFSSIAMNPLSEVNFSTLLKTELSIPTKVSSPDWSSALAGRISLMVNQGINSARIQLTPPELGPIEVRVNLNNEQASVQFISHSASVREALEQAMPRLREMLESSGFSLAEGHVGDESHQRNQSGSDGKESIDSSQQASDSPLQQSIQIGLIDDYA